MSLYLEWNNEQTALEIDEKLIAKLEELLRIAGEMEQVEAGEVVLSFVDDEAIHELNKQYRGIDRPTDVLSFSMLEAGSDEPEIHYEEADEELADEELPDGEEENTDIRSRGNSVFCSCTGSFT
jgi:probable rRNA maturation factor